MSWRTVVISSSAKLDYHMGYMVVRKDEELKIHISEISILIIESTAVSLTAALLSELTKKKIKVIFCDEKRNPSSELVPYYGAHDTSEKIKYHLTDRYEIINKNPKYYKDINELLINKEIRPIVREYR